MNRYLIVFLLCLSFGASIAQENFKVSGTLTDENGGALPYSTVLVLRSTDSTLQKGGLTDSLGNFDLQFSDTGSFMITVDVPGYLRYYSPTFQLNETVKFFEAGTLQLV